MDSQSANLSSSRFLQEQVDQSLQPTEQDIIQKAEELDLNDPMLARRALVEQMASHWRPYRTRAGSIFYINLQERRAYIDHPVDMDVIKEDRRRRGQTIQFESWRVQEVCKSMDIVEREINDYRSKKGLNVVFEEQEQEGSVSRMSRKKTESEAMQETPYIQLSPMQQEEIRTYYNQLQNQYKLQKEKYAQSKQKQFQWRVSQIKIKQQEIKQQIIKKMKEEATAQIQRKNQASYLKAIDQIQEQYSIKLTKYEDLLNQQINLLSRIQTNSEDLPQEIRRMYKQKQIISKQRKHQQMIQSTSHQMRERVRELIDEGKSRISRAIVEKMGGWKMYEENFRKELQQEQVIRPISTSSGRYNIFNPAFLEERSSNQRCLQPFTSIQNSSISEQPFILPYLTPHIHHKKNMSLRLMRKIL